MSNYAVDPDWPEHTYLVAFDVNAPDRVEGERRLSMMLPAAGTTWRKPGTECLEAWWVAEDDRRDRSDRDSAVFVTKGRQADASRTLEQHMDTPAWNITPNLDTTAYDRLLQAEDALGALKVTTSQVDLANVIRAVVDDRDDLDEDEQARVVRAAYDHFVSHGGVDYDTAVGELLWSTVRDAVTAALYAHAFLADPSEDQS